MNGDFRYVTNGKFPLQKISLDPVYIGPFGTTYHLPPGLYGLSNNYLDCHWGKITYGKRHFTAWLETLDDTEQTPIQEHAQEIVEMMLDDTSCEVQYTGWPTEPYLSRVFVTPFTYLGMLYGTRTSSAIVVDGNGRGTFLMRDMVTVQPLTYQYFTQDFQISYTKG